MAHRVLRLQIHLGECERAPDRYEDRIIAKSTSATRSMSDGPFHRAFEDLFTILRYPCYHRAEARTSIRCILHLRQ